MRRTFRLQSGSMILRHLQLGAKLLHRATTKLRCPTTAAASAAHPYFFFLRSPKPYSRSSIASDEPSSRIVSVLTSSYGLSADAARSIAQRVHFKTFNNALPVLAVFKDYGFTEAQIARLVTREPRILTLRPDTTLKPKLEFYRGIGLGGAALTKAVAVSPWMLLYSLESRLLPSAELLKSVLGTSENVVAALKRSPYLIIHDPRKIVLPKVDALRARGVPDASIRKLLTTHGNAFLPRASGFEGALEAIKKLSVSPSDSMYAYALGVLTELPKRVWEAKMENLKNLGWSREQIVRGFAKHPYILRLSVEKIRRNMRFLEEKLEWGPEYVSSHPVVLSLSLEKRMIPRYTVLRILMNKGLLNKGFVASQLLLTEENFLRKFVVAYKDTVPEVADASPAI